MASKRDVKRRKKECEDRLHSESTETLIEREDEASMHCLPHAAKYFRKAWDGFLQRKGTTKLPKKPWMETSCMKVNSKQNHMMVHMNGYTKTWSIRFVMMHGSNNPCKQNSRDSVDSICRTEDCIVPDHHRWLPWREQTYRQCCGANLMCCACHNEIPFPCSHDPPCPWRVLSNQGCDGCKGVDDTRKEVFGSANSSSTTARIPQTTSTAPVAISPTSNNKRKNVELEGEESPAKKTITKTDKACKQFRSSKKARTKTKTKTKDKNVAGKLSHLDSQSLPHVEKGFHEAWVGAVRKYGTIELPRKSWMKTHCMKLNCNIKYASVLGHGQGWHLSTVMMRGTNMPVKLGRNDTVHSICHTLGCVIPNHHRWMPKQEKLSRQSCGASLMCPTCHVNIPLPCSHDPPCEWRIVSRENCSACKIQE